MTVCCYGLEKDICLCASVVDCVAFCNTAIDKQLLFCSVCFSVYGPFFHGALELVMSTLFTTFFLWTSLQYMYSKIQRQLLSTWKLCIIKTSLLSDSFNNHTFKWHFPLLTALIMHFWLLIKVICRVKT